jgi:hypothetical protein
MFHSQGMQSGGEIIGLNRCQLIFEEFSLDQHESSSNNVPDHEKENQQEPNADHATLNAIVCMLLQNLKKARNEQRKHISALNHYVFSCHGVF